MELRCADGHASYWVLAKDDFAKILERQNNVRHACEAETSMMLALTPDLVDMGKAADLAVGPTEREIADVVGTDAVHRWRSFKSRTAHGVIGDPRPATAEKGERLLNAAAEAVARVCVNSEFWALPA